MAKHNQTKTNSTQGEIMKQKRWKPKEDEIFWAIRLLYFRCYVRKCYFNGGKDNLWSIKIGNCFKTKAEAKRKRKQIIKLLKER